MQHAINDLRRANGKEVIYAFDGWVSHYCRLHCWAMAKEGHIYYAPSYYLNDWKEAVFECTYSGEDIHALAKHILFDLFDEEHKRIILDSEELACAYVISNWKLYLTIRGK